MKRCQLIKIGIPRRCKCGPAPDLPDAKIKIGSAENLAHVFGRLRAKSGKVCEADHTSAPALQGIGNLVGIASPRRSKDRQSMMIIPASRRGYRIDDHGATDRLSRRQTPQNGALAGKRDRRRCKAELGIVTFTRLDAIAPNKPDGRGCTPRSVQNAHFVKMLQCPASRR
jgi:hypothetical protein